MSDHETGGMGGMPSDEDLSLPKATVTKMIAGVCAPAASCPCRRTRYIDLLAPVELLPNDITCAKETRDLVIECCVGEVAYVFLACHGGH